MPVRLWWRQPRKKVAELKQACTRYAQALAEQGAIDVPLVAVRRAPADAAAASVWSLLLPAHWVPPVWRALAYAGARPAGLRECAAHFSQGCQGAGLRA